MPKCVLFSTFLYILTGVKWNLTVVLLFISLVFSELKHFFTYLVVWISSLETCLFRLFVHSLIGLFVLLLMTCMSPFYILDFSHFSDGLPRWLSGKESACQCRRHRTQEFNPWVGKISGGGSGNPLQYSFLENSMDRGAWQATVQGITKTWTQLKRLSFSTTIFQICGCKYFLPSCSLRFHFVDCFFCHAERFRLV